MSGQSTESSGEGPRDATPVQIDGSSGEGGGQILRTSLALAMLTGRPLEMSRIRAGRAKPGLRRQHLACVEASARLCHAEVHGAHVGSQELAFRPGPITGGVIEIDIGTAGSTTLVVQTILVPAIAAGVALRAVIRGGTHNPLAPPFEFLERVWLPHLRAMGADVRLTLDQHGFASGGAPPDRSGAAHGPAHRAARTAEPALGQLTLEVRASGALQPLAWIDPGPIVARHATAILSRLPTHVAEREHGVVQQRLGFRRDECTIREVRAAGPANVLMLEIERASGRELVTVHGEKGLRAEAVAERACDQLAPYLAAGVPVGEHLADQLLLPLAVAGGGRFRSLRPSLHTLTNIATIQAFLDVAIEVEDDGPAAVMITVGPPGSAADHL